MQQARYHIHSIWATQRPWTGSEVNFDQVNTLVHRINEMANLRNQLEELKSITEEGQKAGGGLPGVFSLEKISRLTEVLAECNPLNISPSGKAPWEKCLAEFSHHLEPDEEGICQVVKGFVFTKRVKESPACLLR